MIFEIIKTKSYQYILNLLFSMGIIAILIVICFSYYEKNIYKAKLTGISGIFSSQKTDVMLHLAHNGVFPEDEEQILLSNPDLKDQSKGSYGKPIKNYIRNGAITFHFESNSQGKLNGKKITLRPAIPVDDPMGPVCWVTTKQNTIKGWQIQGVDESNILSEYLPRELTLKQ